MTPLYKAARDGQAEDVAALLKAGANPDEDGGEGFQPLHEAAFQGHEGVVQFLLAAGATSDGLEPDYITPLDMAVLMRFIDIVRMLLVAGAKVDGYGGSTPLHSAAWTGDSVVVTELLAWGADAQALDEKGRTPLEVALAQGQNHIVGLLEHGAL